MELIKKSGIIWDDLEAVVTSHLTQQTKVTPSPASAPPQRNDTLLVTANLSMCPKRPYRGFSNVGTMVLYQFLSSIRRGALLQQYGLVRFLIWTNDEDKHRILPRGLLRRRRSAFEAELSCAWLHEVCGSSVDAQERHALRDEWLNIESCAAVVARMEAAGLAMPERRQTDMYKKIQADRAAYMGRKLADTETPQLSRPYITEYEHLLNTVDQSDLDGPALKRLKSLEYRDRHEAKLARKYGELLRERLAVLSLPPSSADFAARDAAWAAAAARLNKNKSAEFQRLVDNHHLFRQSLPTLLWDRRAYEPLVAHRADFFPNAPTTLLDMQPKAVDSVLRQYGAGTTRSGEMSDVLLHMWFANTLGPLEDGLERLWGGFGSELAQCPSFADVARGGSPMAGEGRVRARAVNEEQWLEVMRAWMDWPFRPSYVQLLGRWAEESDNAGEEGGRSGAQGLGF